MANNKGQTTAPAQHSLPPIVFLRPDFPFGGENSKSTPKNIAILVSKKNFKTAVARNKAKRLIKEAVRVATKEANTPMEDIFLKINAQKPILDVQFHSLVELIKNEIIKRRS